MNNKNTIETIVTNFATIMKAKLTDYYLDKIYFQVVPLYKAKRFPHIAMDDIAIIYKVFLGEINGEIISATMTYDLEKEFNLETDDIHELAVKNTPKLFPPVVKTLEGMLTDLENEDFNNINSGIYVVANKKKCGGFAALFYSEIMDKLKEIFGGRFYVLPSSIHEALVMPIGTQNPEELLEIVTEVNNTEVSREDFLSNNVYTVDDDGIHAYKRNEVIAS